MLFPALPFIGMFDASINLDVHNKQQITYYAVTMFCHVFEWPFQCFVSLLLEKKLTRPTRTGGKSRDLDIQSLPYMFSYG